MTVWFAREGDVLWLRTDAKTDWYRNLVERPEATAIVDERAIPVRYEPSADVETDLRRLVPMWRAKYGPMWVQDWFVETGRVPLRLRLMP